ncbi:MAG: hypothetical protein ACXWC7_12610, partial [Chitinophagaceae bacterium]
MPGLPGGGIKGASIPNLPVMEMVFIQPDRISQMGSHPQASSMPGGELAVVWDESVQVNNKYYKRIGVQKRTANGMNKVQAFVIPDTLTATYPVIQSAEAGHSLIAYTMNKAGKNYIT